MKGAILIVGSLLWYNSKVRKAWRDRRLRLERSQLVKVPIEYGRCSSSRGNTYTMTFSGASPDGQALLVPCRSTMCHIESLNDEAKQLWIAEDESAQAESIGASWGCVGALFGGDVPGEWARDWCEVFRKKIDDVVSPVDDHGLLGIPWPRATNGDPVEVDIILAVATRGECQKPTPRIIANAWINNDQGHERYFFENVKAGIRTPADVSIWEQMETSNPDWLYKREYSTPISILRGEVTSGE